MLNGNLSHGAMNFKRFSFGLLKSLEGNVLLFFLCTTRWPRVCLTELHLLDIEAGVNLNQLAFRAMNILSAC